jgi:hypothetical protein
MTPEEKELIEAVNEVFSSASSYLPGVSENAWQKMKAAHAKWKGERWQVTGDGEFRDTHKGYPVVSLNEVSGGGFEEVCNMICGALNREEKLKELEAAARAWRKRSALMAAGFTEESRRLADSVDALEAPNS